MTTNSSYYQGILSGKKILAAIFICIVTVAIACQTDPAIYRTHPTDETDTVDTETHYYVLDTNSEIVDWHYDTGDGTGGVNEACYERTGKSGPVVWCDDPTLIAQTCNEYESQCCCRKSCEPALCASDSGDTVPCYHLDVVNPVGYCPLPEDDEPVDYICGESCTPRSECTSVSPDGSCLDSDAATDGVCLLYDMDTEVKKRCQKRCEMSFCDDMHICLPLYGENGAHRNGGGACVPIVQ